MSHYTWHNVTESSRVNGDNIEQPQSELLNLLICVYEYHNAYKKNGLLHFHLNLSTFLSIGVERQYHAQLFTNPWLHTSKM